MIGSHRMLYHGNKKKVLVGNKIKLGMGIPMIESWTCNISRDKGIELLLEICPRGNNKSSYYYIFVFMINVYIHAIIVLTGNINTCVICKLN